SARRLAVSTLLPYTTLFRSIQVAQRHNIIVTAVSLDWLAMASVNVAPELDTLKIHLKVDTGMRRIGVQLDEVDEALEFIADHELDRKSTRLSSSHVKISYAV